MSLKEKAEKAKKNNDEATKIHNADISKIKKPDESIKELQANLEAAKRNIANKDIEKKLLEILRQLRENSFVVASLCCDILKKNFSSTSYS